MKQRLTAIFAMDMVGYSRLMEADEMGTIVRHKKHRAQLIDPAIFQSGGRIIKEMGDGILVEFSSVAGAVHCAVDIQKEMLQRELELPSANRVSYRIGINLGDIVDDGNEVYGDGINVASRLEQMAEPGGVCISGTAHDTLRSTTNIAFRSLGSISVKNIQRQIEAFQIELKPELGLKPEASAFRKTKKWSKLIPVLKVAAVIGAVCVVTLIAAQALNYGAPTNWFKSDNLQPLEEHTSIAVFPFADLSKGSGGSYLSAGISEDLATEVSLRANVLLITPSLPADNDNDLQIIMETAESFGADYVLAGTIEQAGTQSNISVTLGSVSNRRINLQKAYNVNASEIFAVSKDISQDVVSAIPNIQLREPQNSKPSYHFPNPEAYDLLLRGNVEFARFSLDGLDAAEALLRKAAETDPSYARPQANVAFIRALRVAFGWSRDPESDFQEAEALADLALRIDPATHQAYLAKGLLARTQRQYKKAISNFEMAIEFAPNNADAYAMVALTQVFEGDAKSGHSSIRKAIERNPDHPFFYRYTEGMALFHQERFEEAEKIFQSALVRNPDFLAARLALVSTLWHLGRSEDAEWEFEEVLVRQPDFSLLHEQARAPYANTGDTLRYMKGLKSVAAGP